MEYKSDLKTTTIIWWRFFWRYAIIFATVNLFTGLIVNFFGERLPNGLYMVMLLSGIFANIVASLLVMLYSLNRKFKKSLLILRGKSASTGKWNKLWIWFLYFWRFAIIAFAIGFLLGALLPVCFKYAGIDPVKALKYSKYLGNIAVLPASYLAFISLVCRKEKRQTLKIAVSE